MDSLRQILQSFRNGGAVRYRLIIAPANVPLQRTGYAGSPKAIEQVLGIARGRDIVQGVAGFGAVRLWHECERGRGDALPLLLKCERGDVVDLEMIIEFWHHEFVGGAFSAAGGNRGR